MKRKSSGQHELIFINGFTQQKESGFRDWQAETQDLFPDHGRYGVTWESKTLLDLGSTLIGAGKNTIAAFSKRVVKRASKSAIKKLHPLNWADILLANSIRLRSGPS